MKILYADDMQFNIASFKSLMQKFGLQDDALYFPDGKRIAKFYKLESERRNAHKYQLMFLDFNMPFYTGLEVV